MIFYGRDKLLKIGNEQLSNTFQQAESILD